MPAVIFAGVGRTVSFESTGRSRVAFEILDAGGSGSGTGILGLCMNTLKG
jgi:hypothetical protein